MSVPLPIARRISRNKLFRIFVVIALPVAAYNLYTGFHNPATMFQNDYLRASVGGIVLVILSIIACVLSVTRPDIMITLWGPQEQAQQEETQPQQQAHLPLP